MSAGEVVSISIGPLPSDSSLPPTEVDVPSPPAEVKRWEAATRRRLNLFAFVPLPFLAALLGWAVLERLTVTSSWGVVPRVELFTAVAVAFGVADALLARWFFARLLPAAVRVRRLSISGKQLHLWPEEGDEFDADLARLWVGGAAPAPGWKYLVVTPVGARATTGLYVPADVASWIENAKKIAPTN
ncbi:MAG: hypothetical protein L3K11_05910 [Thermoplasmata archaeon]|nr:hypothetical protein [Thermoplasmata archaeon]